MTHNAFVAKWIGQYNNYDGKFGNQCTDLMRQYVKDVDGFSPYLAIPTTGWAKTIFTKFKNNSFYRKVLNTPNNIPKKGDLLFFKTSLWFPFSFGYAGHVGIVDSATLYAIVLFNQNYYTGSPCKKTTFTYKDCLGWLQKQ